jgi:hypothetical protein
MSTPDVAFDSHGLRAGADQLAAAGTACGQFREAVSGHTCTAAMLGTVPAAGAFHASLIRVLTGQAVDAGSEAARRSDLSGRAAQAAGLGAAMVTETSAVAGRVGADRRG